MSLSSEKIKAKAKESGFDFCGIAKAEPLTSQKEYNEDFVRKKLHLPFSYLETNLEKRLDPLKIMPDASSVITVLLNYYPDKIIPEEDNFIISKYAYGNDYYTVVKKKMDELIKFIISKNHPSPEGEGPGVRLAKALGFVDSGSVLEKVWAQRCGLGWQGKNTLLINKHAGSFFFIGIILTNLELEPDHPETDHCGSCNKCLEACPTGALEQPYQLTISKCIAYHTIENTLSETQEIHGKTDRWIYGCDICQDVCPWNKDIPPTKESAFKPNPRLLKMIKNDWEKLDEKTFEKIFKDSAVKRIGFEKMKKNIENAP